MKKIVMLFIIVLSVYFSFLVGVHEGRQLERDIQDLKTADTFQEELEAWEEQRRYWEDGAPELVPAPNQGKKIPI